MAFLHLPFYHKKRHAQPSDLPNLEWTSDDAQPWFKNEA
jgi:hypothetical protein